MDNYVNCDFILGSAAEIERVWSLAELVLRKARCKMSPLLMEAMLMLKYNKSFWNKSTVALALREVKQENQDARYEQYLQIVEEETDVIDEDTIYEDDDEA